MHNFITKNFLPISLAVILFTLLVLVLPGIFNNTDIRKRAASSSANFQIYPVNEVFQIGETKNFQVKGTFSNPTSAESIDYLKMTISFPIDYFKVPDNNYVELTFSGQKNLDRILRVDGPVVSNQNGKIIIEVAAATPGSGPQTASPVTFASFNLTALKDSPTSMPISVEVNQIVDNSSVSLSTATAPAIVQIGSNISPNPTSVPTIANCDNSRGDANCDGVTDLLDYEIWRDELTGFQYGTRSDFDKNGKVNVIDLEIWRRNTRYYYNTVGLYPQNEGITINTDSVNVTLSRSNAVNGIVYGQGFTFKNVSATTFDLQNNNDPGQGFKANSGSITPGNSYDIQSFIDATKPNGTYTGSVVIRYMKNDGTNLWYVAPTIYYSITLTD